MSQFIWDEAQKKELEWWEGWQSRDTPEFGKGGLSRYNEYFRVFGPYFSRKSILDVGGGAFPIVNWIEECPKRVAVDPLNSEFASKGFKQTPQVEYLDGMAETLPFDDESFDQVLLFNMLDHLDGWQQAVAEACRVAQNSVLIHVHIDGPFAADGMHKILREPELVDEFEKKYGGERLDFIHPRDQRSVPRRMASLARKIITGTGNGWRIESEKSWAGIIRKNSR